MTERDRILSRLLDKYENSRHLSAPGTSRRRVMLQVGKKELPEYEYEDAAVRDVYNRAAQELERLDMVRLEWIPGRPVLEKVVLNLAQVMECYRLIGRVHPRIRAEKFESAVSASLKGVSTPWIAAWRDEVCAQAREQMKVPLFCRENRKLLEDLLLSFRVYDELRGSVTMRAFSSRCFHDTKYFERYVRETFLRVAQTYDAQLSCACGEGHPGEREQLALLGIYARPELYELTGDCVLRTRRGTIPVGAAAPFGLALPSPLADEIIEIDLQNVRTVTFIENKTNYDEYLTAERQPEELAFYHGGFLSPQKRKLIALLAAAAPPDTAFRFWADIDLGGFQMFSQLRDIIPRLEPMRMSGAEVERCCKDGLPRSADYLSRLREALQNGTYPLFTDAIEKILEYKVTIEQETFLN
ncbi:MAG: DUF2220 domain-containing protein [Oscillospiraceae bacterium]|nr:DUF2220 domain-containing protein [Oscillospiraceae bacterium]